MHLTQASERSWFGTWQSGSVAGLPGSPCWESVGPLLWGWLWWRTGQGRQSGSCMHVHMYVHVCVYVCMYVLYVLFEIRATILEVFQGFL